MTVVSQHQPSSVVLAFVYVLFGMLVMFSLFRILCFDSMRRSGIDNNFFLFLDDPKAVVANLTVSTLTHIHTHTLSF